MAAIETRTPIERVHEIVSALATAESLDADADRFAVEGNSFRETLARAGAEHSRRSTGESPSIARLRAAILLLGDITDETLLDVTGGDFAHLSEVLARVDDGTL